MVCGLSGIRVEAPQKEIQGSATAASCNGHAAANCHADPRCVKCWSHIGPESARTPPPRDLNNPILRETNQPRLPPRPVSNPWVNQSPRCHRGPPGTVWRSCPPRDHVSLRRCDRGHLIVWRRHPNGDVILLAVKSSEISEFARDFRACSNVEEKLMVLVRYHHLMVKLESI
ncbi:hypothetical protein EVAR_101278_1 [Eumeta japonica]|uniref:Uncharacterized protein n=1 Tax=Eumeta variegata TaxID=151549 RepID=A0A4C1SC58_EUMVA|nr:hypothetical protein EVAR_101278_1 [Eumeta japonica]